jgi:hypothetical protein
LLLVAMEADSPVSNPEPVLGRLDVNEAYHVTRSGLRELLNGIDHAPPNWRVEFLSNLVENAVASESRSSPEAKLPLQLLSRDPLAAGELSSRYGQTSVVVVRVGLIIERRQE